MGERLSVAVTGAAGYIGNQLVERLAHNGQNFRTIALDVREVEQNKRLPGIEYLAADIRSAQMTEIFCREKVDIVVHLASIVTPGKNSSREFEYSVDVLGTENVLKACIAAKSRKIIVTSSGAAYGYYRDNPEWLKEDDAIRGNEEFPYAHHKRLVEEMLQRYRRKHPELKQLIFRVCTILGNNVANQITNLFEKKVIIGLCGTGTPFVMIWDQDVVECLYRGICQDKDGIYNLAADGTLTMAQIAQIMGKKYISLPVSLVKTALAIMKPLHLSRYGPNQVNFLRYRPVLANDKLKNEFGFIPRKSTREVFDYYLGARTS